MLTIEVGKEFTLDRHTQGKKVTAGNFTVIRKQKTGNMAGDESKGLEKVCAIFYVAVPFFLTKRLA